MPIFHAVLLLVSAFFFLTACDTHPAKTESERFRDKAIKAAQVPLQKASRLYSEEMSEIPEQHLDTLIIVRNLLNDAEKVYSKHNIMNVQDHSLKTMQDQMQAMQPQLVELALNKLEQVVNLTKLLREQIENAKTQPMEGLKASKEGMVSFLAKGYNEQIESCCLLDLGRIDTLIKVNVAKHRDLLVLIRSINGQLEEMIADPEHEQRLRVQINSLRQYYAALPETFTQS